MKKIYLALFFAAAASTATVSQASTFGLNAGATYYLTNVTGGVSSFSAPVAGLHLILGESKSAINFRNYLEYQGFKIGATGNGITVSTTLSYISYTGLLAFNLGSVVYLGIGPSLKYLLDAGAGSSSISIFGSTGLGFNFGPKVFLEVRGDFDFSPPAPYSMTDIILATAQLGFHFGAGQK